jgi:ketosteroid isomerase-like protein
LTLWATRWRPCGAKKRRDVPLKAFPYQSAGRGAEVDDLKATVEQLTAALNKRDLDAWSSIAHDQMVVFNAISPFPVDGKAAQRQVYQTIFNNTESLTSTLLNFQYRVIGETGIVWGHMMFAVKPKDGPMQVSYGRALGTYTKVEGKWRLVAVHLSAIPLGN